MGAGSRQGIFIIGATVLLVPVHARSIVGYMRELVMEFVTIELSGTKPVCKGSLAPTPVLGCLRE
jgi:hypothetical protein